MNSFAARFETEGFVILPRMLSDEVVADLASCVSSLSVDGAGTRNVLEIPWCRDLARRIMASPDVVPLLPANPVVVQCTYFLKTRDENWLVPLHRDLFIPVRSRIDSAGWSGWSEKEGMTFVQPPRTVLEGMVAIRVHLEDNTEMNSPLQVVAGSHQPGIEAGERVSCLVSRGGAIVMRPLILHASSRLKAGRRRVLHFLIGPRVLPDGAQWEGAL